MCYRLYRDLIRSTRTHGHICVNDCVYTHLHIREYTHIRVCSKCLYIIFEKEVPKSIFVRLYISRGPF